MNSIGKVMKMYVERKTRRKGNKKRRKRNEGNKNNEEWEGKEKVKRIE